MKKILAIGTGGTIASEVSSGGLEPELSAEQLLQYVPEVRELCDVDCIQPFGIDSTNMEPEHWLRLARLIQKHYDRYDGFVITHGTDTMAYTAAALSYLVQYSPKPIILTGSQRPMVSADTDSRQNLRDSFLCACSNLCGVAIAFNGRVILGTRAKKTYTKSFKAFESINYPDLAYIRDGRLITFIQPDCRDKPTFFTELNPRVALLKLIPGIRADVADYLLQHNEALIIESFGVGGLPDYSGTDFYEVLRRHTAQGKTVIMTTQVENEGSDLALYQVGSRLKSGLKLPEAYDMTTEAVVAKLMWILGQTKDSEEIRRLFYTPVANDLLLPAE